MDINRLLCNAASPYLVGLFHSSMRVGADACRSSAIPTYLKDLGCIGAWCYEIKTPRWTLSPSLSALTNVPSSIVGEGDQTDDCPDFVHHGDRAAFLDAIHTKINGSGLGEIAHRLVLSDHRVIHAKSILYRESQDDAGKWLVCAIFDTTNECNADRRIRALAEMPENSGVDSHDVQFDWDLQTSGIQVGASAARYLGLNATLSDHTFASLFSLVHPSDRDRVSACLTDHLRGTKTVLKVGARVRLAEGHYQWVTIHGNTVRNGAGQPVRFVGHVADVNESKQSELSLKETEEWLRGAVESSFDAIQILRSIRNEAGAIVDFEILELNKGVERLLGKNRSALIGARFFEISPNMRSGDFEKFVRVVESRIPFEEERIQSFVSQGARWIHIQGVPVGDGISISIADITTRKEDERVLLDSQRFIEKLALSLPEFVYLVDAQETTITYQNRDFLAHLGYPSGMFAKGLLSLCELIHPDDQPARDAHRQAIASSKGDGVVETTCRLRTAADEWRWYQIRSVVFRRNNLGEPIEIIRTIHDVTAQMESELELKERVKQLRKVQSDLHERQAQLEELNSRLAALATTDGLTGLYNYRAFQEKLDEEVRRSKRYASPLAVVFADVDDFKAFNDRFGHPAGDERLRDFGALLKDCSRDSDFVARYGGEEFAIILSNTNSEEAATFTRRVIDRLNKDTTAKRITASFGCVQLEPSDFSKEDLLHRADDCLYTAKGQGKNRIVTADGKAITAGKNN